MTPFIVIIVVVIAGIGIYILSVYNGLVTSKVRVKEGWSGIDVQLKRRANLIPNLVQLQRRNDLVPNLVETVKGYAKHEKNVLENVTKARTSLMGAKTAKDAAVSDNILTGALKSLFAVAESYPDLKASDNFKHVQEELSDTETKIAASRQFYNSNVLDFNTKIQIFPNSVIANLFRFERFDFFEADEGDKKNVKVKF